MRIRPTVLGVAVVLLASACSSLVTGQAGGTTPTAPSSPPSDTSASSAATAVPKDLTEFAPSGTNQDPSKKIAGIEVKSYTSREHVQGTQRVAYDQSPPFGGAHAALWAECTGVVYPKAVRNENMVHALEHGAVWIAYNPDKVAPDALAALAKKVNGQPYSLMSPYPGLNKAVSLQSWGHRLKLDDPADPRVDQFITALKLNSYTYPEPGATCDSPSFNVSDPPPFDPNPAPAGSAPVESAPLGSAPPSS